jgi:predicted acyltransferase
MATQITTEDLNKRLLSLDFMRGFIMVLLTLEAAGLYDVLYDATETNPLGHFFEQFHHHPWNGLRFWDLIQPGFMFIAGTAMAYSVTRMREKGLEEKTIAVKIFKRCGWLFFWGVLSYAVKKDGLAFELWNVLTQLSFTILLAYLIFSWRNTQQILASAALLLLTETLYRFTAIPGFEQPFTDQQNFGNYVDLLLMGKINKGGWVAINCIPTAVHTIGGAVAGKLLMSGASDKTKRLVIWGLITLVLGYALDLSGWTPIIKRISTSSFTLASLGWCLLMLAACYYMIDVKERKKGLMLFTVVGMNSIFIYLFFEIVGGRWFNGYISAITTGLLGMTGAPALFMAIVASLLIFALEWGLCYFLYRKKIFFRI